MHSLIGTYPNCYHTGLKVFLEDHLYFYVLA
jgi:hypothetical protein